MFAEPAPGLHGAASVLTRVVWHGILGSSSRCPVGHLQLRMGRFGTCGRAFVARVFDPPGPSGLVAQGSFAERKHQ